MEVKMQYLVDLEDVPRECKVLLDGVDLPQWDILMDVSHLISEGKIVNSIRELESFRKELYRIDRRAADVSHILKGYLQTTVTQDQLTTEQQQQEQLAENIENYVNSFANVEGKQTSKEES
tara:strand:- start:6 stop:368 length:363 start_codon:yes stop_codon:yes gene_type:complete